MLNKNRLQSIIYQLAYFLNALCVHFVNTTACKIILTNVASCHRDGPEYRMLKFHFVTCKTTS